MKKTLSSVLSVVAGAAVGSIVVHKKLTKEKNKVQQFSNKNFALFSMMNQWVKVKQEGKNLAAYFEKNGYKNIAIYGMSYVGETLLAEFKDSAVCVKYAIDKNADKICVEMNVVTPEGDLQEVDAVVVTAITFFDEIEDMLVKRLTCPIISLEDVLYDI